MVAQALLVGVVSLEEVGPGGGEEGCPAEKEEGPWEAGCSSAVLPPSSPSSH